MRILLTAHAFVPRSVAGVEVYTFRLARALRVLGHEVLVLAAVHDLAAAPYSIRRRSHDGIDVAEIVSVHPLGTLQATYDDPGIDRAAEQILRQFRPDCVHVQHLLNLSAGIVPAARAGGAVVVLTLHDYWLSCPRDGLRMRADLGVCVTMDHVECARCLADSPYLVPALQRGASRAARRLGLGTHLHRFHALAPRAAETLLGLARLASPPATGLAAEMDRRASRLKEALGDVDLVLAPTAFAARRAIEFGVPAERVRLCAYGVVEPPILERRAGPRRRFGYVGTLAPHKGVHVLVEAFRGLPGSDLRLEIHGNLAVQPGYVAGLQKAAAGDGRVRFWGSFPEGEQVERLASIDVLVVPSLWWENSPLTILEALARGVPVVASATGGVPEMFEDGVAGLVFEPGNVGALRRQLDDVAQGRRLVERLAPLPLKTVAEGASELVAIYEQLTRTDGGRRPTV
jgi:glycosyltransferase involved in cell wall biosynthesis